MDRFLYAIESSKGYLCDIEEYTENILTAPTFADYDYAVKRLTQISGCLQEECWVTVAQVPFPHPVGIKVA